MSARHSGLWLIAGAVLFWLSWSLMPGVGITDASQILELVARHRPQVALSVAAQLLSSACYAPALVGLASLVRVRSAPGVRWAAALHLIGAMGSAADAVFHLLAHAMTAPGLGPGPRVPLMQEMQGPNLRFILPLIAAFFLGSIWLSFALRRARAVPSWNPALYAVALLVGGIGAASASRIGIAPRNIGLTVLALVAAAQCGVGVALTRLQDDH